MQETISKPGFYWVKFRQDGRWEPLEYDGVAWMSVSLMVATYI